MYYYTCGIFSSILGLVLGLHEYKRTKKYGLLIAIILFFFVGTNAAFWIYMASEIYIRFSEKRLYAIFVLLMYLFVPIIAGLFAYRRTNLTVATVVGWISLVALFVANAFLYVNLYGY